MASEETVSCRLNGDIVVIYPGGDGQGEILFLTRAEATVLAENLEAEVIGVEGDEFVVADVSLTRQEALHLMDVIERVLGDTGDTDAGKNGVIDWRAEGF